MSIRSLPRPKSRPPSDIPAAPWKRWPDVSTIASKSGERSETIRPRRSPVENAGGLPPHRAKAPQLCGPRPASTTCPGWRTIPGPGCAMASRSKSLRKSPCRRAFRKKATACDADAGKASNRVVEIDELASDPKLLRHMFGKRPNAIALRGMMPGSQVGDTAFPRQMNGLF